MFTEHFITSQKGEMNILKNLKKRGQENNSPFTIYESKRDFTNTVSSI